MIQKTALGVDLQSPNASGKSRKRRRGAGIPVTSRYFEGIAPGTSSFRFTTIVSPDSRSRYDSPTGDDSGGLPRHTAKTRRRFAKHEKDEGLEYNLFAESWSNAPANGKGATSNYFLHSPSSAYGSVSSLGPLIYTWMESSSRDEVRSKCSRGVSSCNACSEILAKDAFRHFHSCPIFREKVNDYMKENIRNNDDEENNLQPTCVEIVGRWAEEHALRHVCPNQCFLWAFAPCRDWMLLRKSLKMITPIGDLLDDWTCRLVDDLETMNPKTKAKAKNLHSKTDLKGKLPRTIFVSLKTEKSFTSIQSGRKLILDENEREIVAENPIEMNCKSKRSTFDESYYKSTEFCVASPFGLIQELFHEDPWRVLVCAMLLNKTQRKQNLDAILYHLFKRWPTADSVVTDADDDEENIHLPFFALVRRAGQGQRKAVAFIQLSRDYLDLLESKNQRMDENTSQAGKGVEFELTREEVKQLFNCGDYAADAYQIFIRKDFKSPIMSNDHMILAYVEWKRSLSVLK